jgi:lipopolysaccharide/colanic/teichoic acid biosynthesis glycosyltransferase
MKRLFDLMASLGGLICLSPLILAVAALIKLDSTGQIFYRSVRVGRYGRPFRIFKFRTMVVNPENLVGPSSADDDPRITEVWEIFEEI